MKSTTWPNDSYGCAAECRGSAATPTGWETGELGYGLRRKMRVTQVWITGQRMDLKESGEVGQSGNSVHVVGIEVERAHEKLLDFRRVVGIDL